MPKGLTKTCESVYFWREKNGARMVGLGHFFYFSVQFSSVTQSCPTLCNPMNRSMPGLPVHHHLPEFTQTHIHRVGDAIQPSRPLSAPFSPAPNPSQHQGLFQWVSYLAWGGQSTGVSALASVLPMNTQDWSPLGWTGCISLQSKGLSRVFSNTTVQKHQFFSTQLSSQSNSLIELFHFLHDMSIWQIKNKNYKNKQINA